MAAKYLQSTVTGVVHPYSEPAMKCADFRLMAPAECAEYEASLGVSRPAEAEPAPEPKPEPVFEEVHVETSFSPEPEEVEEVEEVSEEDTKVSGVLEDI